MNIIKNGLTIIGAVSIVTILWVIYMVEPAYHRFNSFDDKAFDTYRTMFENILKTGNVAEATVWKTQVDKDIKALKVEEVMRLVANEHDFKVVGELPFYKQVETDKGKPFRFMKSYMFCNSLTAAKMVQYSDAFSAYLPCRITLVEDKAGNLWLYSLNMDLMIHGGTPLPDKLKNEVLKVKETIIDIMKRGASGEF